MRTLFSLWPTIGGACVATCLSAGVGGVIARPIDVIPPNVRTARAVSSFDRHLNKLAAHAVDGRSSTFWQSENKNGWLQWLEIDLGAWYELRGFLYLPRQDGPSGHIREFELYVSGDGTDWVEPVAKGQFPPGCGEVEVVFPAATARFVRLVGLSSIDRRHEPHRGERYDRAPSG